MKYCPTPSLGREQSGHPRRAPSLAITQASLRSPERAEPRRSGGTASSPARGLSLVTPVGGATSTATAGSLNNSNRPQHVGSRRLILEIGSLTAPEESHPANNRARRLRLCCSRSARRLSKWRASPSWTKDPSSPRTRPKVVADRDPSTSWTKDPSSSRTKDPSSSWTKDPSSSWTKDPSSPWPTTPPSSTPGSTSTPLVAPRSHP